MGKKVAWTFEEYLFYYIKTGNLFNTYTKAKDFYNFVFRWVSAVFFSLGTVAALVCAYNRGPIKRDIYTLEHGQIVVGTVVGWSKSSRIATSNSRTAWFHVKYVDEIGKEYVERGYAENWPDYDDINDRLDKEIGTSREIIIDDNGRTLPGYKTLGNIKSWLTGYTVVLIVGIVVALFCIFVYFNRTASAKERLKWRINHKDECIEMVNRLIKRQKGRMSDLERFLGVRGRIRELNQEKEIIKEAINEIEQDTEYREHDTKTNNGSYNDDGKL